MALLEAERNDNSVRIAAVQAQADASAAAVTLLAALGRLTEKTHLQAPRFHEP